MFSSEKGRKLGGRKGQWPGSSDRELVPFLSLVHSSSVISRLRHATRHIRKASQMVWLGCIIKRYQISKFTFTFTFFKVPLNGFFSKHALNFALIICKYDNRKIENRFIFVFAIIRGKTADLHCKLQPNTTSRDKYIPLALLTQIW